MNIHDLIKKFPKISSGEEQPGTGDPILDAMIEANATMLLWGNRASGVPNDERGVTLTNLLGADGNFGTDSNADGIGDGWDSSAIVGASISNNIQTFTPNGNWGGIDQDVECGTDSIMYVCCYMKTTYAGYKFGIGWNALVQSGSGEWEFLSRSTTLSGSQAVKYQHDMTTDFAEVQTKQVIALNLTADFGAGNEPSQAEMDTWIQSELASNGYFETTSYIYPLNSPFVNPWNDLINSNDAALQNFDEMEDSGWRNEPFLSAEGDDYSYTNKTMDAGITDLSEWGAYYTSEEITVDNHYKATISQTGKTFTSLFNSNNLNNDVMYNIGKRIYTRCRLIATSDDLHYLKVGFQSNTSGYGNGANYYPASGEEIIASHLASTTYDLPERTVGFNVLMYPNTEFTLGDSLEIWEPIMISVDEEPDLLALEVELGRELTKEDLDRIIEFDPGTKTTKINVCAFLGADGTNDNGLISNDSGIDPTGTEDFAYSMVFTTPSVFDNFEFLFNKNLSAATDGQFNFGWISSGRPLMYIEGSLIYLDTNTLTTSALHEVVVARVSGTLTCEINEVETYNLANPISLISKPNFLLFARSFTAGGDATGFNDSKIGYLAFYYNGATGLNKTDINTAHNLIKAKYGL